MLVPGPNSFWVEEMASPKTLRFSTCPNGGKWREQSEYGGNEGKHDGKVERRDVKSKGEKEKIYPFECRVPKDSKERQESLPQ